MEAVWVDYLHRWHYQYINSLVFFLYSWKAWFIGGLNSCRKGTYIFISIKANHDSQLEYDRRSGGRLRASITLMVADTWIRPDFLKTTLLRRLSPKHQRYIIIIWCHRLIEKYKFWLDSYIFQSIVGTERVKPYLNLYGGSQEWAPMVKDLYLIMWPMD